MLHKWQIITLKLNYGINDYDVNNNIFNLNVNENELDEPQLENQPNLYLNNFNNNYKINQKSKISGKNNSKGKPNNKCKKSENIKCEKNNNNLVNNKNHKSILNLKNRNRYLDDFFDEPNQDSINKLNKTQNIYKEKEEENKINKQNNKTFDEKFDDKAFEINDNNDEKENHNSLDNLILEGNSNDINNNINNYINEMDNSSQNERDFNCDINKSKSVDRKKNINNFMPTKSKPWAYSYYKRDNNGDDDIFLKIKKKKPAMNNTERQELFNNLYNDSKKRKEKFKKLSMEKEAKFNSMYTFTPKIITNKINEKYLKNLADSKFNTNTNPTQFFNSGNSSSLITVPNNNLLNNMRTDTNRNYNNQLGVVSEEDKGDFTLDFMTRLAEYEKIKKNNLEKIRNEVDVNIRGNNVFKNKNKYLLNKIPSNHLFNKSQNYLEIKQKNLEKITKNMYEEQGITFQPKTNKSFNGKIKNDIIERNKVFIKDKQEKLEKYSNLKEKECTFMPKINNSSAKAILNNSKGVGQNSTLSKTEQNSSDVSKRLFDYQNKYKEKLEDIRSKYKESYSFKPEISKNTDSILNNKKKVMEQIKENENELINNVKEGNNYNYEFNNNNYAKNNNNDLLMKKMRLGELEEISKRISELSEENMIYTDEKLSSQKNNNKNIKIDNSKMINENNQIIYNDNSNSIESNNFQIKPTLKNYKYNIKNSTNYKSNTLIKNQPNDNNSDKIMQLAQNLINNDLSLKQNITPNDMNYYNNVTKDRTNDFGSIMMNNNTNSCIKNIKNINNNNYKIPFVKKNNYAQEYDFDNKGSKKIMNFNYYDNLL